MGGLGDLVLSRRFLDSLRAAHRDAQIALICRAANAGVFSLWGDVKPDRVVALDFNPYMWSVPSDELRERLGAVLQQLPPPEPDLFVSPELRPTWLSWVLAAHLRPLRSLIASPEPKTPFLAREVLVDLGLRQARTEYFSAKEPQPEEARYRALLKRMHVALANAGLWQISDRARDQAGKLLISYDLEKNNYLACFPSSAATTQVKRWPADRYVEVLSDVYKRRQIGTLLIGDASDAPELTTLMARLKKENVPAGMFVGAPDDLPIVAALLSQAHAYIGTDTGLAHLGAALNTPGITIYGGGTWPMYAPWHAGTVGIVNPLPCFGCFWDCAFDRGICVESIPAKTVSESLEKLLAQSEPHEAQTLEIQTVSDGERRIIADAARVYRAAQVDRRKRLEALVRTHRANYRNRRALRDMRQAAKPLQTALAANRRAAAERAAVIDELQLALEERDRRALHLQEAADVRGQKLEELQQAHEVAQERVDVLEPQSELLERFQKAAQERAVVIEELQRAFEDRDRRAAELRESAEADEAKVHELQAALNAVQRRVEGLESQSELLERFREVAQERATVIAELKRALDDRDRRAVSLQAAADQREAKLQELKVAYDSAQQRVETLESQSALLGLFQEAARARLEVIVKLDAALAERDARIARLEGQTGGPASPDEIAKLKSELELYREAATQRAGVIAELKNALEASRTQRSEQLERLREAAEARQQIIFDLTDAIAERDARIAGLAAQPQQTAESTGEIDALRNEVEHLRKVADERLAALKQTDEGLRAITAEAERRAIMLSEVTSLLQEKTGGP
jgi:ADP-heptose:LPS heptosyltransferase/chromosome segregation ATPase